MLTIILLSVAAAVILILAIALGISTEEVARANRFHAEWLSENQQTQPVEEAGERTPDLSGSGKHPLPDGGELQNDPDPGFPHQPNEADAENSEDLSTRRGFENGAMDLDATQRARAALAREKAEFEAFRDREKARLMKAEADMKQRLNRYY